MERYKGKKIAVLGFGIEGISVVNFLTNSEITVFDEKKRSDFDPELLKQYEAKGVKFEIGDIKGFEGFTAVFRSPGFHPKMTQLVSASESGVEITSATKLFFDLCPCPIIGVTGTKGKGTTSTLIYEMLKKEGFHAFIGGNIGTPPLSFFSELKPESKVVLELSSFQLIDLEKSPHVSVMLMTTSEHLDYHEDVYEYIEAKRNIFKYQTEQDFAIVNRDYPASNESDIHTIGKVYQVSRAQEVMQGCFVKDDAIYLRMDGEEESILSVNELGLLGKHNHENVCAAVVASICAGASMKSILPVLKSFKGLEHRIEFVRLVGGVKYYDDSFSTTPETAIAAIESFEEPKILILGGSSKNSDFSDLGQIISESGTIKAIIGIGLEWERIKAEVKNLRPEVRIVEGMKDMNQIVRKAAEIGEIGDVVLLSPACASFDMFLSYKDRGEQFKSEVSRL